MCDLREQTPVEYFKEQVESALARQHLQAGDLTEVLPREPAVPVRAARPRRRRPRRAAGASGLRRAPQTRRHRTAGPAAQPGRFLALHRRLLFRQLRPAPRRRRLLRVHGRVRLRLAEPGGGRPSARSSPSSPRKFVGFMDVLADISERHACLEQRLLRLYKSGSAPAATGTGTADRAGHRAEQFSRETVPAVADVPPGFRQPAWRTTGRRLEHICRAYTP